MSCVVGGCLAVLSIEDIRKKVLPVWILVILLLSSMAYGVGQYAGLLEIIFSVLPGIMLVVVALLLPKSIGIGDGILGICYGLVYGWKRTCIWLMLGFFLVAVFGVFLKLFFKTEYIRIPFIPFLTLVHVGMSL